MENTNRETQVEKRQFITYKSETTNRETTDREIPIGKINKPDKYTSENTNRKNTTRKIQIGNTNRKRTLGNTTRKIQLKIQIERNTNRKIHSNKCNSEDIDWDIQIGKFKSATNLKIQLGKYKS